jgi:hypothetical protein
MDLEKAMSQTAKASARAGSAGWLVPAGLLLLSSLPIAAGALRLTQLSGAAEIMPANPRFSALPLPVVLHIVSATVFALALAALVALVGALARPSPPSLSTMVSGDAELAARARPLLPGALDRVSIAVVDGSTTTYAHFGADEHTQYEIGSITKTFTGLLLADAIQRGEVTADTTVGALLPLGGAPIADVTLAELASHRSGLSTQGMQVEETIPFALRYLRH